MIDYYKRWFSIKCFHAFYTDGYCRDLAVEPTDECRKTLRRHKLLFKPQENGAVVINEQRNSGTEASPVLEPKIAIESDTIFTFRLTLKNPDFLNITNLNQGLIQPFSAFIFTNAPGASESSDGTVRSVEVHDGALGSPLPIFGKVFRYPLGPNLNGVAIAAHDEAGQFLFQINLISQASEVTIDMNGFPEGIYQLSSLDVLGGTVASTQVFISNAYRTPQLFGFLQVRYTNDILSDAEDQHAFTLSFENRQIRWVYNIDVKEREPDHPDNLDPNTIQLENTPVAFTRSVVTTPPKSVTFTSNQPIALRQKPYTGIQLTNGSGTSQLLIAHMPNPETRTLVKDGASDLRSEMRLTIK